MGFFELHAMYFEEYDLLSLPKSVILKFHQQISKNQLINITCYFIDQHGPTIDCSISNVIATYKEFTHTKNIFFCTLHLNGGLLMKYGL